MRIILIFKNKDLTHFQYMRFSAKIKRFSGKGGEKLRKSGELRVFL
jgi:hypothetical protein